VNARTTSILALAVILATITTACGARQEDVDALATQVSVLETTIESCCADDPTEEETVTETPSAPPEETPATECCRGPMDPGGHIVDAINPGLIPIAAATTTVELMVRPGAAPDTGTTVGQCRTMTSRADTNGDGWTDWGDEPAAAFVAGDAPVPPPSLIPNVNPDVTLIGNGLYQWLAPPGQCYYVVATRVDSNGVATTRTSPLVGVLAGGHPVDDLNHCWPADEWGSLARLSTNPECGRTD
jgi:hypothetical protein